MLQLKMCARNIGSSKFRRIMKMTKDSFSDPPPIDWKFIVSRSTEYKEEAIARKAEEYCGIITKILALSDEYSQFSNKLSLREELRNLASLLPNTVHPDVKHYNEDFKLLKTVGEKKHYSFKPLNGAELLEGKDLLKMASMNLLCGERSYYFVGDLVELENALIDYTVQKLLNRGFTLVSVPDILSDDVLKKCGMDTTSPRTQVRFYYAWRQFY